LDFKKNQQSLSTNKCKLPFLLLLCFGACAQTESSRAEFALGTVCSVTLFDQSRDRVYRDIFSRIHEIENLMSVNIPASDVSRINAAAGIEPVQVHDDVYKVIERAVYFARLSGGAFDPSVGPLVSLWGIGTDTPRLPSQKEIDEILPLINWQDVELDPHTRSVFLRRTGMALDLGGIAKGYAADEAAAIVKNSNVKRAIIDLGGNIVICGEKKDKSPWRAGIQNPGYNRGDIMGIVNITAEHSRAQTVVTSGVYERFFEENGGRFHHIFSPFQGYPADNGLLSVTVISHNSMDADALSTAVFVLGYEKGMALIEAFPGAEAVFVFEDKTVRTTNGVKFALTDNMFRLVQE
jgi:thiamine biosynthesis lipoprotein